MTSARTCCSHPGRAAARARSSASSSARARREQADLHAKPCHRGQREAARAARAAKKCVVKRFAIALAACSSRRSRSLARCRSDKPICKFTAERRARGEGRVPEGRRRAGGDDADQFHADALDPGYEDPESSRARRASRFTHSLVDQGDHLGIDSPTSLPNVITVLWRSRLRRHLSPRRRGRVPVDCAAYFPLAKRASTPD